MPTPLAPGLRGRLVGFRAKVASCAREGAVARPVLLRQPSARYLALSGIRRATVLSDSMLLRPALMPFATPRQRRREERESVVGEAPLPFRLRLSACLQDALGNCLEALKPPQPTTERTGPTWAPTPRVRGVTGRLLLCAPSLLFARSTCRMRSWVPFRLRLSTFPPVAQGVCLGAVLLTITERTGPTRAPTRCVKGVTGRILF